VKKKKNSKIKKKKGKTKDGVGTYTLGQILLGTKGHRNETKKKPKSQLLLLHEGGCWGEVRGEKEQETKRGERSRRSQLIPCGQNVGDPHATGARGGQRQCEESLRAGGGGYNSSWPEEVMDGSRRDGPRRWPWGGEKRKTTVSRQPPTKLRFRT